jgi:hypothetical protein
MWHFFGCCSAAAAHSNDPLHPFYTKHNHFLFCFIPTVLSVCAAADTAVDIQTQPKYNQNTVVQGAGIQYAAPAAKLQLATRLGRQRRAARLTLHSRQRVCAG